MDAAGKNSKLKKILFQLCFGRGSPEFALQYVRSNGLDDDDNYAYYQTQDVCTYMPIDMNGSVTAVFNIKTRGKKNVRLFSIFNIETFPGNETLLRFNRINNSKTSYNY